MAPSVSLSLHLVDMITKHRAVAACLWAPMEFAIVIIIAYSCNYYVWGSVVWYAVETPWLKRPAAILTWSFFLSLIGVLSGIFVDFLAYKVFANVQLFSVEARPTYTLRQRVSYHADFIKNASIIGSISQLFEDQPWYKLHSWHDFQPFIVDSPFSSFMAFGRFYLVTAFAVQTALLFCDLLYCSGHILQHKIKPLYEWTQHDYHHHFRFPLSSCGPWLGKVDLLISQLTTFTLPCNISCYVVFQMTQAFEHLPSEVHGHRVCFYRSVLVAYIHLLNHHVHSGKQMPLWSGAPLCPPLGFALGLDQSIPNHESHHNFHTCGYGLLSVADRLLGTNGYPASDPRFPARAVHMGKAAMAQLNKMNAVNGKSEETLTKEE